MQRLGISVLTLWMIFFVPSLIIWALMVRANDAGMDRFHSTWLWLEDKLAYPLVLSPITDRSWFLIDNGTSVGATIGFVLLIATWAIMFALPLVLISTWWRWVGNRIAGNSGSVSGSYANGYTASPIPIPGRISSSPLAALYVVTIPIALALNGMKRLWGGSSGPMSGLFWPVFGTFTVVFLIVTSGMAIAFGFVPYWERFDVLNTIVYTSWYGYLDTLRIPHLFHARWLQAANTIYATSNTTGYNDWPEYMGMWYRHEEFRTLVWITAARHALGAALAVVIWKVVRRVF